MPIFIDGKSRESCTQFDPCSVLLCFINSVLYGKTSYRQIWWNLEAARLDVIMIIGLKFDRHLGSGAVGVPVYFPGDRSSLISNLAASSLREILL